MSRHFIALSLALTFVIVACGSSETPAPTQPAPVVKVTQPSPLVTATQPAPQVSTKAPLAPTATPVLEIGPDSYAKGINPLTGLQFSGVEPAFPIAIKVANYPRYVRPLQAGLSLADIVFEHYAEGGTTRFTAIFYGNEAPRVGPIRSARLIDTVIPEMFRAALVASGSSTGVLKKLSFKDWYKLFVAEATGYKCPPICRESDDTNAVFTTTTSIYKALADKGSNKPQVPQGFKFHGIVPSGGSPVNTLRVDYSSELHTEWRYNAVSGRYERWSESSPLDLIAHFDKAANQQITAANVIVLFVNHVVDSTIPEDFDTDGLQGHFSTEIQLWGSGPGWLIRDGQRYEGTWVRAKTDHPFGIVDKANNLIPLKPGNTWIQLVGLFSDKTVGLDTIIKHKSPTDKGDIPNVPTRTPTAPAAATPKP